MTLPPLKLYRVLIETVSRPASERIGSEVRFDIVVWATDERQARSLAIEDMHASGFRNVRVVPDRLVEVIPDHPRVVASDRIYW